MYGYFKQKYQVQEVDLRSLLEFELKQGFASIFSSEQQLEPSNISKIEEEVYNLEQGYPLAYITNQQEFYKYVFYVDSNVLIPRPETEFMVDVVIKKFAGRELRWAADIGAGSGCIGISLLLSFPNLKLIFVENSPGATSVLLRNLRQHNIDEKRYEVFADISSVSLEGKDLDLVVSNPPYIAQDDQKVEDSVKMYEPSSALYADDQGYKFLKEWSDWAIEKMGSGGEAFFEFGLGQQDELKDHSQKANLNFEIIKDQYGVDRFWHLKGN